MSNNEQTVAAQKEASAFLQTWAADFKRSIETATGEKPTVACRALTSPPPYDAVREYLWWKQSFGQPNGFTVWFGAAEETWSAIGGEIATDRQTPRDGYVEILSNAHQRAADALAKQMSTAVACPAGNIESPDDLASMLGWEVSVALHGKDLTPVLAAALPAIEGTIRGLASSQSSAGESDSSGDPALTPMMERLMDLELPLAVALGRAVLPIREILKMTSGSMIELDRNVGEYVDLLVHGTIVARGEIVSVKGNYGVRIKEIISRQDRMTLPQAA